MYGISKLLESMYTRVLAQQLPKVMVNAVHPGGRGQGGLGGQVDACVAGAPPASPLPSQFVKAVDACSYAPIVSVTVAHGWCPGRSSAS